MRWVGMVAFLCVILSGPAVSADDHGWNPEQLVHRSVSVITRIDRNAGFLVIRQGDGQIVRIYVDRATEGDSLEALHPGDIIREECTHSSGGTRVARRVLLVRPAWREIGTPEM